jgi:hypothetical protein
MDYQDNEEIEEIILDEEEVADEETPLEEEDAKTKQVSNLNSKRGGDQKVAAPTTGKGGVANASATGAGTGKYAGLYKDGTGGGVIVPEPVDVGAGSGDAKSRFMASVQSKKAMRGEAIDVHMDAMFDGEDLTEDFKNKAATIFEAAINERVEAIRTELEEEYSNRLVGEIEESKNALTQQLDSYLSYVVQEWVEENRLAVEKGIRTEVAEEFMDGLRNLFLEHDIMVPEAKIDIADRMADVNEQLKDRLDEEMRKNIELTEQVKGFRRHQILDEMSGDLTLSQRERFRTLAEGVTLEGDDDQIRNRLGVIRESYFNGKSRRTVINEETAATVEEGLDEKVGGEEQSQNISESMRVYADTLRRITKR